MFTPTKEQLEELRFKKGNDIYYKTLLDIEDKYLSVDYKDKKFELALYEYGEGTEIQFYPESIEDLQTIIRVFKIK